MSFLIYNVLPKNNLKYFILLPTSFSYAQCYIFLIDTNDLFWVFLGANPF
jgi:hypothetical protein